MIKINNKFWLKMIQAKIIEFWKKKNNDFLD